MVALLSGLASVASLVFDATSRGSGKLAGPRRSGAGVEPEPSAVLTLSPQAEALAGFADKGILVSQGKLENAVGAVASGSAGRAASVASVALSTAGFDADKDGFITMDEFLKGLAKTKGAQAGSDFSQTVMQLMDRNGNADGSVADQEFAAFSTAFAATGAKRAGVA